MKIKKYLAKDFQSALNMAKSELGQDAIILNSRYVKGKGIFGFFASSRVEITVAADDELKVVRDRLRQLNERDLVQGNLWSFPAKTPPPQAAALIESGPPAPQETIVRQMHEVKSLVSDLQIRLLEMEKSRSSSDIVQSFYELLVSNNIDREMARKISGAVESRLPEALRHDSDWAETVILRTLQEHFPVISPIDLEGRNRAAVVMLLGPTGVGKTTTIAKLAANFTFVEGKKVALITLDTYRIAAAEQLRTFADIIGIPVTVVFNASELAEALEAYRNLDLVFIDTAGRSPFNAEHMSELQDFMAVAGVDEKILVLSVTTGFNDLLEIIERFAMLGVDKLIFTKLDETMTYGQIVSISHKTRKPVAYFTTGQNVPEDIEVPDSLTFARMLLGKRGAR